MRKSFVFWIISLLAISFGQAQSTQLRGTVTDAVNGEALPYASLIYLGTTLGTATDSDGNFVLPSPERTLTLEVSYLGYDTQKITLAAGRTAPLHIRLVPNGIALQEVLIQPGKEKYSKKNNPAVRLVKEMIDRRESNDPRNRDYFQYDQYEKMLLALNEYEAKPSKNGKKGKFDFLAEYVDTLEEGTPILPVLEKESVETVFFRKEPKSEKRVVKGHTSHGIDEMISQEGVQQFLSEVFREVDIFQNDIPLFLQRFVSPLSSIGPNYYKYYLLDTLMIDQKPCVDLGFVPFHSETFGFTGHLFVALDSTYFVHKAVLNVPKDINLNFVSQMRIEQTFERTADSIRLITKNDIQVNFKLSEKSKGMYARRLCMYRNHGFDQPRTEHLRVFDTPMPVITLADAHRQTEHFWQEQRPQEGIRKNPKTVQELMKQLREVPLFYYTEKAISILFSGYMNTHKDPERNYFEYGPMNSSIGGNDLEGFRMRAGGNTTPAFSKHWCLDGYVAYGTKDEKMKYDLLVEYSFNERKKFRKEFPRHSLRFEYMYDVNKLGEQYLNTGKDNMLLSIKRMKDLRATYLRMAELGYLKEHYNGISYGATLSNRREYSTHFAPFHRIEADKSIRPLDHLDQTKLTLNFRYGSNEKFFQTRNHRIPITFDAWIIQASHEMSVKNFLGSDYNYHRTDIGLQKRFWFSAFGCLDVIAKAGKVWNKVPYPLLILPNANLTYTIQPETYTNMNALEFINDEYVSWDLTYYLNGNLLNRIPLIKQLKWREVFCFRGLWGNLTDKNNPRKEGNGLFAFPEGTYQLGKTPYMEASIGIENILKAIRIDYVWRLNYRHHADIQKRGIRATIQLSF